MEKIWILILFLVGFLPATGQEKCFDKEAQIRLLNDLDKARTCDTLLELKQQKIDSLFFVIGKKDEQVFLNAEKYRIENLYVENLKESIQAVELQLETMQKDLKREQRRKKLYKISSGVLLIGCVVLYIF